MKRYISIFVFLYLCQIVAQNEPTPGQQAAFDNLWVGTNFWPVWQVGLGRINVDGKLDEPQWDTAQRVYISGEWMNNDEYLTNPGGWTGWSDVLGVVRVLYDDENLFLSLMSYDDFHYGGEDDNFESWCMVDGAEIFIQPAGHDVGIYALKNGPCNPIPEHVYMIALKTRFNSVNKMVFYNGDGCVRCPLNGWHPGCEDDGVMYGVRCAAAAVQDSEILARYDGAWCVECIFPFSSPNFQGAFANAGYTTPPTPGPQSKFKLDVTLNDDDELSHLVIAQQYPLRRYCEWWGTVDCHTFQDWYTPHFYPMWAYAGPRTSANEAAMAGFMPDIVEYYCGHTEGFYDSIAAGLSHVFPQASGDIGSGVFGITTVPNPVRDRVEIRFHGSVAGLSMRVGIYDTQGRCVRTLWSSSRAQGVKYEVFWDGRNESGKRVPAGIYICKIGTATKRIIMAH